jgi:hypothetical protein
MDTIDAETRSNVPAGVLGLFIVLIFICVRREKREERREKREERREEKRRKEKK